MSISSTRQASVFLRNRPSTDYDTINVLYIFNDIHNSKSLAETHNHIVEALSRTLRMDACFVAIRPDCETCGCEHDLGVSTSWEAVGNV
jgi:hypothetical protein